MRMKLIKSFDKYFEAEFTKKYIDYSKIKDDDYKSKIDKSDNLKKLLFPAIRTGNVEEVKNILSDKNNIPTVMYLQLAAEFEQYEIIDLILNHNPSLKDKFNQVIEWVSTIYDKDKSKKILNELQSRYDSLIS